VPRTPPPHRAQADPDHDRRENSRRPRRRPRNDGHAANLAPGRDARPSRFQAVQDALSHGRGRRGAGALRSLLAEHGPDQITRSELEERFLTLCREADLPRPAVNTRVEANGTTYEVDFFWRAHQLIAETDGWGPHHTRAAFEADRRRDADLLLAGFRVVRLTWRQITREPGAVAATLRALLAA
jgi:very-short-patch-repair endonuclease